MRSDVRARFSRRRVLVAGAGTLAVSLVAACSGGAAPAPTAGASAASPTSVPQAQPATAPAAQAAGGSVASGSVQVRWNGLSSNATAYIKKWVSDWNSKEKLKVAPDFSDWGSSFQKITTGIAGGIAPDVYAAGGLWTPVVASKGGAYVIDQYVKSYKDWSDWYPVCQKDVVWNGHTYGVPYETATMCNTGYRKSIFDQKGIEAPPSTWDEAKTLAKELVVRNGDNFKTTGWDYLISDLQNVQVYEDAMDQLDFHIFSPDKTKPTNNTPEGEEALGFMVWFVQNKLMPATGLGPHIPNVSGWATGLPAQGRVTNVDLQYTHDYAPAVFNDTVLAPPLKQTKRALVLYVNKYMMFSKTKQPDAAWQILEAINTPDFMIKAFVEANWSLPARKAMESAKFYEGAQIKVAVDNLKYAVPREAVPQSFDVQSTMSRIIDKAIRGTQSVKATVKELDDAVTKILKG